MSILWTSAAKPAASYTFPLIQIAYTAASTTMAAAAQALQSARFDLSDTEVEQLLAQMEVAPDGDIAADDWIAALIDWRAVQVGDNRLLFRIPQVIGSANPQSCPRELEPPAVATALFCSSQDSHSGLPMRLARAKPVARYQIECMLRSRPCRTHKFPTKSLAESTLCSNPSLMLAAQESPEWEDWIRQAFAAFDVDGSGRLSKDALNAMLCGDVCQARFCTEYCCSVSDESYTSVVKAVPV